MEPEVCIVKDAVDSSICGKEAYTYLTTDYSFDTGKNFNFSLGVCKDHYDALVDRYTNEFADISLDK